MQCIILCAGFATRLHPLTLDRPKHLLPVAGRPMLDHLLDRLADAKIETAWLVTNHRFASVFSEWLGGGDHTVHVSLLDDGTETNETRLGSIGDLRFALDSGEIRDDFAVLNGDNLFTFSLVPVIESFRKRGNTIGLFDVGSKAVASRMGHATCDAEGRVVKFVEKPKNPPDTLASIGIYVYQRQVRELVNRYLAEGNSADRTGDFVAWLHKQVPVYAHAITADAGVWYDIGSFDQYQDANRAFGGESIDATQLSSAGATGI